MTEEKKSYEDLEKENEELIDENHFLSEELHIYSKLSFNLDCKIDKMMELSVVALILSLCFSLTVCYFVILEMFDTFDVNSFVAVGLSTWFFSVITYFIVWTFQCYFRFKKTEELKKEIEGV